jgi:hypothetical protein
MLRSTDVRVDFSDDIVISNGDMQTEYNDYSAVFRNAQRRLSARYDDMDNYPEICAGVEVFLQQYINSITITDMEMHIRDALLKYGLLSNKEFSLNIYNSDEGKVTVVVKFLLPEAPEDNNELSFSVFVNQTNQRSYI